MLSIQMYGGWTDRVLVRLPVSHPLLSDELRNLRILSVSTSKASDNVRSELCKRLTICCSVSRILIA